jgi:pimeloyl-ACP methyl ester carboxylesterase
MAPPVVLVHGLATSARRTWQENGWVDILGDAGRTVVTPDLLGHGTADKPHDPKAYEDLAATLAKSLPGEPVDAIGFSLGARTLLAIAADEPGRFRRLVVAGVGANLFRHDRSDLVIEALRGVGDRSNPVVRYFAGLAEHPDADPEALAALLQAEQAPITEQRLANVTLPVLVVIGDGDFAGPGDPLVEALPDARLVVLPRTDHFATPKSFGFIDAALDFLGP